MRELVFVLQRYLAIVVSKVVVGEHYFVQPRLTCGYEIKVWCICIASVVQKFIRTTTVFVLCVIAEFYIDLKKLILSDNGESRKAAWKDVVVCILCADLSRGTQEEASRRAGGLCGVLTEMLGEMEGTYGQIVPD